MRNGRRVILGAGLLALAGAAGVLAQKDPRVIKVSTRRWVFTPNHIALKKGEPVVLELTAEDIFMGMNIPDFGVRSDIVPGKTMRDRWELAPAAARVRGHEGNRRLHQRWQGFNARKKRPAIADVAIARELEGSGLILAGPTWLSPVSNCGRGGRARDCGCQLGRRPDPNAGEGEGPIWVCRQQTHSP